MNNTAAAQLVATLKRELAFSRRELQRINCEDSDSHESRDEIGRSLELMATALFELELDGQPETSETAIAWDARAEAA